MTLQFFIRRAYEVRENERRHDIRARENAKRHDNASEGDNRGGSNNGANVEGGRQAKGWYDVRTGRVTIVLPNNKNAADVRETVLFAYGKTIACEQTQTPNVTIKRYL